MKLPETILSSLQPSSTAQMKTNINNDSWNQTITKGITSFTYFVL